MGLIERDTPYHHWEFTAPVDSAAVASAATEGPGAVSNQLPDRLLVVPERGGLITGWRCNGVEWLYLDEQRFADPSKSVRGGIPVLFPICGGLPGDQLPLPSSDGGSVTSCYPMAQHGFARDQPWQLAPLADGSGVELTLSDNAATRLHYPFAFRLTLAVRLEPSALAITATVEHHCPHGEHKDTQSPMPFSLGLHPYFRVSSLAAAQIEGLPSRCLDQVSNRETSTLEELQQLANGVDLLAGPVSVVSLVDAAGPVRGGSRLSLETSAPLDLAVIWTDPPRPMVCLEPWTAPRQALISGDRRLELAPGASSTLHCRYRVSGSSSAQASG